MRSGFALIALFAVLACGRPAWSATYVIGVEDLDYLPHYAVTDGDYRGFAREVLDAFAEHRGIEFRYRPYPVERLFRSLVSGEIDFKYPDSPDWNRTIKAGVDIAYSAPVAPYVDGVLVPPESLGKPLERVRRLGTVRGFTPWAWLDRLDSRIVDLRENPSFSGLLRQAIAGRVDGAYVNEAVGRYFLRTRLERPGALVFDPALPHVANHYLLSSSKHPALIAGFSRWLRENADRVALMQRAWGITEH